MATLSQKHQLSYTVPYNFTEIESPQSGGGLGCEFASLISPGVRKAFDFSNGAQLVLGAAAPIGLNRASPDYGVFLFLSFEHFFRPRS